MATNNPKILQDTLKEIADGHTSRELVFRPQTGEILAMQRGEKPSPDLVVATRMAEDGFYADCG